MKPKFVHIRSAHITGYGWAWFKANGPDDSDPAGKNIRGPFRTEAECDEHVRRWLGPDYTPAGQEDEPKGKPQ